MKNKITIILATCNRYDTTLPLCLMSIFNQSLSPNRVVIVDDSKIKNFYNYPILINILELFKEKNIEFDYFFGPSKGLIHALQIGLDNIKDGWIFKIDDDNILSYNTLELFEKNIKPNVGAMSGVFIDKNMQKFYKKNPNTLQHIDNGYYNRIENIYSDFNIQFILDQSEDIKKVQHIYSNYFYRRELAIDYPLELSPYAYREETIFTYEIFRKGFDLLIIPKIRIYHLDSTSGEKQHSSKNNHKKNELIFIEKLKEWNIVPNILQIFEDEENFYTIKNNIKYLITPK